MSKKPTTKKEVQTTGHQWDGIEELNTPLPRWWLWTFYATIVWAIGYMIAYPAIPLVTQATQGLLGSDALLPRKPEVLMGGPHATVARHD